MCSVNCIYRTRCQDFALFYDAHRTEVDALVADYFDARREQTNTAPPLSSPTRFLPLAPAAPTAAELRALIRLEVKTEMPEAAYIWVDKDDRAELVETAEVLRRAERGAKAKHIYKVSQEMELRFQLVPRKRIEKAKRTVAVEAERAAARRRARSTTAKASAPPSPTMPASTEQPSPTRRARRRLNPTGRDDKF